MEISFDPSQTCVRALMENLGYYPFHMPKLVNGRVRINGLDEKIMDAAFKQMNLCYNVTMAKLGFDTGRVLPNGSFTGQIGMAERNETDVLIGPRAYSYERYLKVDLSEPIDYLTFGVGFRYPEVEPDIAGFIKPYTWMVWILVFISLTSAALMLALLNTISMELDSRNYNSKVGSKPLDSNIASSSLVAIGIFFGQSLRGRNQELNLKWSEANKIFLCLWLFSSFIITMVYKSNLMAMLTTPKLLVPFSTLEQLVDQNKVKIVILAGTIVGDVMKVADKNSVFGKLNTSSTLTTVVPLKSIAEGKIAFISPTYAIKGVSNMDYSMTGSCRYTLMKEEFLGSYGSYIFVKNSPYIIEFNKIILRLKESGIMGYWMAGSLSNASHCLNPSLDLGVNMRALALRDFYGVFFLLFGGYVLSLVAFLGEVLVKLPLMIRKRKMDSWK